MAVTITRTAWIDDDGTGTTGTVINAAWKTELYGQIDGALAKVAQLAGGNSFTQPQTVLNAAFTVWNGTKAFFQVMATGPVLVNTNAPVVAGLVSIVSASPSANAINIQNSDPANSYGYIGFYNSVGQVAGYILQTGATTVSYVTSSDARLKDDTGRATDLAALRAVVVHDFAWKADGVRDRGVFAQEAHAHYPRAIHKGTDETTDSGDLARPWMTDYSKFVPDLIVGWQQHEAALAELRARLGPVQRDALTAAYTADAIALISED
jgi:hypothetical protein